MGTSHQLIKSKANTFITAWSSLAKDDSFGGYTLAQFQQLQADAQAKSAVLTTLDVNYAEAMMQRDAAHSALSDAMLNIVDGVKGDTAKHGADSVLYKTMGYVPRSERSSGLTRKTTTTTNTETGAAPVAAVTASASA